MPNGEVRKSISDLRRNIDFSAVRRNGGDQEVFSEVSRVADTSLRPQVRGYQNTILELSPGDGRFTFELIRYAAEIDLLDMDEASIEACLQRLRPLSLPVNYYVNDGHSCGMLPASQRYDIIASFDSMVHMPPDVIAEYLRQFTPRLKPDGFMWLDHSGRGARELGDRTDMTPEKMAEIADDSGLRVDTTWFRNDHDCISVLRKRARHNGAAIGNGLDQSPHSQKPIFVSVVVPVYDVAPELLRPCLESLRLQTLREDEFEIIIVDDASTNKATRALIEEFAESVPHCRLVRHETNRGLNQARRAGRASALGTHILFVDGDDVLTRDAVETLRMHAHKTGADIVMGGFLRWSPSERAFRPFDPANRSLPAEHMDSIRAAFGAKVSYTMCGRLFRAEVLPDELFVLPDLISEDVATFVRALLRARSTHYIGRTVYFYTDNPTSKTSAFSTKHVNDMFRLFQDWREQAEQFSLPEYARAGMDQGVDRLVAVLIRRCLATDAESPRDHLGPLRHIHKLYVALPRYDEQKRDSRLAKFLERLPETRDSSPGIKKEVLADLCTVFPPDSPSSREFPLGIQPTDLARRLAGAIVIVCQVDFHLRAAATWAHALQARGHRTVVLDNTKFVADGRRGLRSDETELFAGIERIVVESSPYELDALATARVVLTFNDFNDDLRDAVEYRQRLDLPTVAVVESINDFLRVDFEPYRYLPYRRCTHVFLAGDYDRDYFQDRQTAVVGMPVVEKLTGVQPVFPDAPLVAINVNFTYGVLESHREEFVRLAVEACKVLGIDYSVTQHPMDNGDLADYNVTELSQYELIDDCSVFVSRFATGIIEALASGKPAVYFNPHGEKVPKFSDPMGAFAVANSVQELKVALAQTLGDIEEGVDFRERALPFLRHHAAYVPGKTTSTRFVDAVEALLESSAESAAAVASLVEQIDAASAGTEAMLGPFTREDDARVHETDVFAHLFAGAGPGHVLLDIGAHFGSSLAPFAEAGWTVVGCEPDPSNRARLEERFGEDENVSIDPRAVSYEVARGVPLFTSEESTGISSLRGFRDTHHEAGAVDVTTVAELVTQYGLERIDFLKVDVEGFDWHVLKGVPWDTIQPEAIICEFEDSKTIPLGYRYQDMADYLLEKGYFVYVSEWHPIVRYGMSHEWKQLMRYPSSVSNPNAWGNILGFKQDPGERTLASTFASSMGQDLGSAVLAPPTRTADGSKEATEAVGVLARAQPSRPDRLTTEIAGLSESNAAMRKWLDIKLEELRDRDRA